MEIECGHKLALDTPGQLFSEIPLDVWGACIKCSAGRLADGNAAKIPLGKVVRSPCWGMIRHEFAIPKDFAVRVACMLKFYDCLSLELAHNFAKVLDVASSHAETILSADTTTLPGLVQPLKLIGESSLLRRKN